jgi:hypothetical protein
VYERLTISKKAEVNLLPRKRCGRWDNSEPVAIQTLGRNYGVDPTSTLPLVVFVAGTLY